MTSVPQTDVWLRGPVAGVPSELQPVAHAFLQLLEDIEKIAPALGQEELWFRPGGAASIGFHLTHMSGSIDRLFTYARGKELSATQSNAFENERRLEPPLPTSAELVSRLRHTIESGLQQLRLTEPGSLLEPRPVGRAKLPSTVLGLLFHAAEHAQKHTGQIITTAKIVRESADTGF